MENLSQKAIEVFKQISQIPRGSGNEKQISDWLVNWAKDRHLEVHQDDVNNVIIKIKGTGRYAPLPYSEGYILQGHMDMVCQKTSDSTHDFLKDPIIPIDKDGWLMTNGETTLGADNGIAVAIMLALADSPEIEHKPLEFLITVDEERGLVGASSLSSDVLESKKLINIDSEELGEITIGCAGSRDTVIEKSYKCEDSVKVSRKRAYKLSIHGGKGGHSGMSIHEKIANSHILTARILDAVSREAQLNLLSWAGGTFRNAITGDTTVRFAVDSSSGVNVSEVVDLYKNIFKAEYGKVEPDLKVELVELLVNEVELSCALSVDDSRELISLILIVPHGVIAMSEELKGLVETSNNLPLISLEKGVLSIKTMHRSAVLSRLDEVSTKLKALASLVGATATRGNSSVPWEPDPSSGLLTEVSTKYSELFGVQPKVMASHGGLECGVIGSKYPGMEMVSIGPNIKGAHTPKEMLELESVSKISEWLLKIVG